MKESTSKLVKSIKEMKDLIRPALNERTFDEDFHSHYLDGALWVALDALAAAGTTALSVIQCIEDNDNRIAAKNKEAA